MLTNRKKTDACKVISKKPRYNIGILASVGVVAYQGYTESAAIAATKANHKTAIDFTTANFMKCVMGGDVVPTTKNYCKVSGELRKYEPIFVWEKMK